MFMSSTRPALAVLFTPAQVTLLSEHSIAFLGQLEGNKRTVYMHDATTQGKKQYSFTKYFVIFPEEAHHAYHQTHGPASYAHLNLLGEKVQLKCKK